MSPRRVCRYEFVMYPGSGIQLKLPRVAPDADGRLRAKASISAEEANHDGRRFVTRRNGSPIFEEWLRWTDAGLVASRRKTEEKETEFTPPLLLVKWPLQPQSWTYTSNDRKTKQRFQMWTSVPVRGPEGETPGVVVLSHATLDEITISAERHFLPGLGLVREIDVVVRGGQLLYRQELTLTAVELAGNKP
jgi:hypothetical protein